MLTDAKKERRKSATGQLLENAIKAEKWAFFTTLTATKLSHPLCSVDFMARLSPLAL